MVWDGFKTQEYHCHHQHHHHGCHLHHHHNHIHHDPIFPSMPTNIKPDIPIFAVKPDEDVNLHLIVFFLWHSLRQLNRDSIKLRHPKIIV